MKRTADEAFAPSGAAMFDPKAYFKQWQAGGCAGYPGAVQAAPSAPSDAVVAANLPWDHGRSAGGDELLERIKTVSAVRCAAIVQEKMQNMGTVAKIEALHTMALKSSFKLREDLVRQPHVRKLCTVVLELVRRPPPQLALKFLAQAVWSLTRMPDEVRGDAAQLVGPAARALGATPPTGWHAETASKILWCCGRNEAIYPHRKLCSQIVAEILKDQKVRVAELSQEGMVNLLFAISKARQHVHKGDHRAVTLEENDEKLFDTLCFRVKNELDSFNVQLLGDLIHMHSEVGLRREGFFKAAAPRIIKDMKDLREDKMAKVIKAYQRFMIPLKDAAQGFRTMAVVAKGDFMRPSEKPKRTGKVDFDKPQPMFPKTQLHARA